MVAAGLTDRLAGLAMMPLWTTPSEIPIKAAHPRDAHAYMDFFYKPEIAAQVTDWVLYMTPVIYPVSFLPQRRQRSRPVSNAAPRLTAPGWLATKTLAAIRC